MWFSDHSIFKGYDNPVPDAFVQWLRQIKSAFNLKHCTHYFKSLINLSSLQVVLANTAIQTGRPSEHRVQTRSMLFEWFLTRWILLPSVVCWYLEPWADQKQSSRGFCPSGTCCLQGTFENHSSRQPQHLHFIESHSQGEDKDTINCFASEEKESRNPEY